MQKQPILGKCQHFQVEVGHLDSGQTERKLSRVTYRLLLLWAGLLTSLCLHFLSYKAVMKKCLFS